MTDQELRIKCVEMAIKDAEGMSAGPDVVVSSAKLFYDFITHDGSAKDGTTKPCNLTGCGVGVVTH